MKASPGESKTRIAFVGNQDNNAYRLVQWIRNSGPDAHLYLFARENATRSKPELVDAELTGGYPPWIRLYDDDAGLWPIRRGPIARRIDSDYDLVVTSGATGLLAAGHFKHTPVVHLALGSEVSQFPLWSRRLKLSLRWRAASMLMRRNLKRVAKVVTLGFRPELSALEKLGHADKAIVWGWPEDPEGNRRRVDRDEKFLEYARADISEYWLVDPDAQTVEVFVFQDGAYTLLVKAGAGENARSQLLDGLEVAVDEVFVGVNVQ